MASLFPGMYQGLETQVRLVGGCCGVLWMWVLQVLSVLPQFLVSEGKCGTERHLGRQVKYCVANSVLG
jgi:hypothetical protein